MKTIITEYKPHGIWLVLGIAALLMLPVHLWVLYSAIWLDYEYSSWFFSTVAALFGLVFEPIIIFYLLTTVQVVVAPRVVYKRWVFFGMPVDGEEIVVWEPENISLTRQQFSRQSASGEIIYTTIFYIDARYETKSKNIYKYKSDTDARKVAAEIAKALDVPFKDFT